MAKLRKILEPGERVLARTPPRWVVWLTVVVVVATPAAMSFWVAHIDDDERLQDVLWMFYFLGGLAMVGLLVLVPILRWRIMATDRRILVRHGLLRRELEEVDRDDVRAVRHDGHALMIEGDGRQIETLCHPLTAGRMLAVIEPSRAPQAPSSGATGGVPAADEAVLLRAKSPWTATLLPFVLTAIPVGAIPYLMAENISTLEPVALAEILGFPALMIVAAGVLIIAVLRSQKQWMITGRRIVTVEGVFRRRVQDIRRDWIEETAFDGATLTVRGGGHSLDIPLGEASADDLHRALGRWFPWRGAPAAPAGALLRADETLLLRRPRKWATAAGFAVPLLILVAGAAGYSWFGFGEARGRAGLAPLLLVLIPFLAVLPQMFREAPWSLLVTDRRFLLRRRHDRGRYDELPLDAIEEIEAHTKIRPRVTLRAQGRSF
jgi:hypothetical protein